ncbi:MAG: putative O-methyltransferase YrrM [Saprospiraceae bacterium]|jgi:predicted O-methyltransferase YrrM
MFNKSWNTFKEKIRKLRVLLKWVRQAHTIDTLDSPHIAAIIKKVIWRNDIPKQITDIIEKRRSELLNSRKSITPVDLGAGSFSGKTKMRSIAEIARNAVSEKAKCRLLYNTAQYYKPKNILELGTSLGISSLYLSKALPKSQIYTIEGDLQILGFASSHKIPKTDNIQYINADFEQGLNKLLTDGQSMDLILIDGAHHSKLQEALLPYYRSLSHKKTVWIIDDIYWSEDMTAWWNSLIQEKQFNVAIDLFQFGILYYNDQIKEPINVKILPKKIRWKLGLTRPLN